jgi:hypothetical protein
MKNAKSCSIRTDFIEPFHSEALIKIFLSMPYSQDKLGSAEKFSKLLSSIELDLILTNERKTSDCLIKHFG